MAVRRSKSPYPYVDGFTQHGVTFESDRPNASGQVVGSCPFCGKDGHLYVNAEQGLWDCKSCLQSGSFDAFLALAATEAEAGLRGAHLHALSRRRGITGKTFAAWGVGFNGTEYTLPASGNLSRRVKDVRRASMGKDGKLTVRATSGAVASLVCPKTLYGSKRVWLAEGEWDGMALWEALHAAGLEEDVFSVPGSGTFQARWAEMFADKDVVLLFDNDKAGKTGTERTGKILRPVARTVQTLAWPADKSDGYDINDAYRELREGLLDFVREHLTAFVPSDAEVVTSPDGEAHVRQRLAPLTGAGLPPDTVVERFRQWLHIPETEVLDVLFGSVFANRLDADPLWLFFVAPPGGSKTELLVTLTKAPRVTTLTTLTPHALVSGANFGGTDPSLLPKLDGHVLVIKDFTTILSMNPTARDEIFGTLRDAYDGKVDKVYGNNVTRRYEARFGILAGVTPIIETFSASSGVLGERFIRYRIRTRGRITAGKEAIKRALRNLTSEGKMRTSLQETAALALSRPIETVPTIPEETLDRILGLAQWIASLRGVVSRERYTGQIQFKPTAEIGTRLAKQLATLGLGIAVYKGETTMGQRTYQTLTRVAADTAPDRVEEVVRQLYVCSRREYATTKQVAEWTRLPDATALYVLQDLDLLRIVQRGPHRGTWALTESMTHLMDTLELYQRERAWAVGHRLRTGPRMIVTTDDESQETSDDLAF